MNIKGIRLEDKKNMRSKTIKGMNARTVLDSIFTRFKSNSNQWTDGQEKSWTHKKRRQNKEITCKNINR